MLLQLQVCSYDDSINDDDAAADEDDDIDDYVSLQSYKAIKQQA